MIHSLNHNIMLLNLKYSNYFIFILYTQNSCNSAHKNKNKYKFFEKSIEGLFLISTPKRRPRETHSRKLIGSQIAVGFSLLGWFALHGYIVSNNNIHWSSWTATGISSRQRRFHYRVRLRDAYPGGFRVHKAHQMRRRGETGLVSEEKKRGNTEKNGRWRRKKSGEMRRKIQEGAVGITVYIVDI